MSIQYYIVIAMILAAAIYVGWILRKRSKAFSPKAGCGEGCGCNGDGK